MDVERESIYQLFLAGGSVVLFVGAAVYVSTTYRTNGDLSAQGGTAMVGTIGLFVLLMLLAGAWLERQDFSEDVSDEA